MGALTDDLGARGLIHDSTDLTALGVRLNERPISVYVGFDPTADSLHVGHLLGQLMLRRFQLAGHKPYALAGGATGMVGDPSGRSEERRLLDRDELRHNVNCIKTQLERILDFGKSSNGAVLVDNAEWTEPIRVLDFLRDVGKHITVNQMLGKESVRSRLEGESGLSFTEFSYMLLQANDFRELCARHGVEMQMGGSDQWGNITAGIDLIRRVLGHAAYGLTWPLVTRSDGLKFGKTASGAVWLDPKRTSAFQFHQFWMKTTDTDSERLVRQFSLAPREQIDDVVEEHRTNPERRLMQRLLAEEMTTLVHGREAFDSADEAASILFGGDPTIASVEAIEVVAGEVPTTPVARTELGDVVAILVKSGLSSSNSEARRALGQGAIRANGRVLGADDDLGDIELLYGRWLLLRKGKSNYHLVEIGG